MAQYPFARLHEMGIGAMLGDYNLVFLDYLEEAAGN